MTPAELVSRLDEIGWFTDLPKDERTRILETASGRDLSDPLQVAEVVARLVVSADGVCDPETYQSYIGEIAEQIPFAFKPDKIEVTSSEEEEDEITIKITLTAAAAERSYTCVFDQDGDWADICVLEFIEGILEDIGSKLRLFGLPVEDPQSYLAICIPEAFERAVSAGLLPEPAADEEEDGEGGPQYDA
jgi:hypothetical protein